MQYYSHPMQAPVRRSFDVDARTVELQELESLRHRLKALSREADISRETASSNDVYDALGTIIDGIGDTVGKIKLLTDAEYEAECRGAMDDDRRHECQ